MKFVVLGTSGFTLSCTRALLDAKASVCALINLPKGLLPLHPAPVASFARTNKIPYHEVSDINSSASISLIKKYAPDYIFSTWPKIIGGKVLCIPRAYTIGTHPAALPFNRGRHPLHWMIVLGIKHTKLSYFAMDEGVDSGRLLLQVPFSIGHSDTIADAVSKMNRTGYTGTRMLCKRLRNNSLFKGSIQQASLANYWRKRTLHDVLLDMRMSTDAIARTVRSFSPPYPCAKLIFENHILDVCNASIVRPKISAAHFKRMEHGKIIAARQRMVVLKTDDGIIELNFKNPIPKAMTKAKCIHPPSKYISKWAGALVNQLSQ